MPVMMVIMMMKYQELAVNVLLNVELVLMEVEYVLIVLVTEFCLMV